MAVLVSGVGFVAAAVLTPVVTERVAQPHLGGGPAARRRASPRSSPAALYTRPALLVAAFFLGLACQGIKIVVDTLVQTHVDDAFRGRVFSLYDVIFNVAFVAAAAVGRRWCSPAPAGRTPCWRAIALGYLATAGLWYARVTSPGEPAADGRLSRD